MLIASLSVACIVATAAGAALAYRRHARRRTRLDAELAYHRIKKPTHADAPRSTD